MRKILALLVLGFLSVGAAWAQMSNEAITEYLRSAISMGKSEQQIGEELIAKGVSIEQLQQVRAQLSNRMGQTGQTQSSQSTPGNDTRIQSDSVSPVGQPEGALAAFAKKTSDIFGHDLFHSGSMTFEPNENAATPSNYKLGPGDEVNVDIWGASEASFKQRISPEGVIMIPQVGAITLNGLTVTQATEKIRRAVSRRYAGLGAGSTQISVTLGRIRTINVHVMGEVKVPGTYRLSSFTTLFNALYRAGGITESGSLRNVQLVRDGAVADTVDIYKFLFHGTTDNDLSLQDGDVVIVPPYEQLVTLEGQVKRPMRYELRRGETFEDALRYAGGYMGNAYREQIKVERQTGREKQIYTLTHSNMAGFEMADGDKVTIGANLNRYENMVSVEGAVFRPGAYELGGDIATVRQLIAHADGLMPDAFMGRAVVVRENDDLSLRTIAIDLAKLMQGECEDVLLQKNDILVVSKITDLQDNGTLTITGWVNEPGTFPYADNTTIEDMVVRAGGFKRGASTIRADVARRIYDPKSKTTTNQLAHVFTLEFSDGLTLQDNNFVLEPYDIVIVRRSPDYSQQKKVVIKGEVLFPGEYILTTADERLSSVIERAGGPTPNAYISGSRLTRKTSSTDREAMTDVLKNINNGLNIDDTTYEQVQATEYPIGIELGRAIKRPHSDYDIVLQDGDEIVVPGYDATVRINGEVMRPNAVSFIKGKHARYYINQAGGFGVQAKKRHAYVIYPNGTMSRARWCTRIEPGSEIVVPKKEERQQMTTSERLALASATASLVSVVIALIKLFN